MILIDCKKTALYSSKAHLLKHNVNEVEYFLYRNSCNTLGMILT